MPSATRIFLCTSIVLGLCLITGCGKKGPPLPPLRPVFPEFGEFSFLHRGEDLQITWSLRTPPGEGPAATPETFHIYRAAVEGTLGEGDVEPSLLRNRLERVAEISVDDLAMGSMYRWLDEGAGRSGTGAVYAVAVQTSWKKQQVWGPYYRFTPDEAPMQPEFLKAEVVADGVRLSRAEGESATAWRLYRSTSEDPDWLRPLVTLPDGPEHLDSGVQLGTDYTYVAVGVRTGEGVTGLERLGDVPADKQRAPWGPVPLEFESAFTAPASARYVDLYPPPVPSGLRAFPEVEEVTLLWNPVEATDLAGYHVYRRSTGGSPVRITTEPEKDTVFKDADVLPGQTWIYTVTTVDRQNPPNESSPSDPAEAVMPKRVVSP